MMSFQQGHALLIGIGTHQHHSRLDVPITVADAKMVQQVLQDPNLCGYRPDKVTLLKETAATKAGILEALGRLRSVGPDETVFLFFAGHGSLGTDGSYYLVSHDVRMDGRRVLAGTGVSENELLERLNAIPAKRLFMVFNACHSGHIAPATLTDAEEMPETLNPQGNTANALLGTGEGRILIVASREQQYSYIGDEQTTIFTQALTNGLRGQAPNNGGTVSAFGLYEYLYYEVTEAVERKYKQVQEPVLTVIQGVGPFPVALYRGASTLGSFADDSPTLEGTAAKTVSPARAERSFNRIINVGSGAVAIGQGSTAVGERGVFVGGSVGGSIVTGDQNVMGDSYRSWGDTVQGDKIGGDKVGGDKITVGNIAGTGIAIGRGSSAQIQTGDAFELSGDYRAAILNIKSTLSGVTQTIQQIPDGHQATKQALLTLIGQLEQELSRTPASQIENAGAVAQTTQFLMDLAAADKPNKSILQIAGEGLKQAAQNMNQIMPEVPRIANKIIQEVRKLTGF
jgi:hypothetical protein